MKFLKKKLPLLVTALLLILAFFLRSLGNQQSPPSPYWEEVALGYDAYSLAETGRDHHGNPWPLTAFESFGDWKPSLYFYAALPFVKMFGLTVTAVRLPSLVAAMALVLGVAYLAKLLAGQWHWSKDRQQVVFLAALFVAAISPWLITFARAAWESNLAAALVLWAINCALLFVQAAVKQKQRPWLWLLTVLLLVLAAYCYHATRLSAALLGIALGFYYLAKVRLKANYPLLIVSIFMAILLMWPLLQSLASPVGQQRFQQTSIFTDISVIEASNAKIAAAGGSWWARLLYHRYIFFAEKIAANFSDHFAFNYLFIQGDANPRHSIQTFGEFYLLDTFFFLVAIYLLIKNRRYLITYLLLFFLLVTILPAALTTATPHALRTLAAAPVFLSLLALALSNVYFYLRQRLSQMGLYLAVLVPLAYLIIAGQFFYQLLNVYPRLYAQEWQYGYPQLMTVLATLNDGQNEIYISREQGRPAMYYWFYNQIEPTRVQAAEKLVKHDQGEYLQFENLTFFTSLSEIPFDRELILAAGPDLTWQFSHNNGQFVLETIEEIRAPSGELIWQISRLRSN